MYIVSMINPLSKSDGNVPVALCCFEERRKFIRISEVYEDSIARVRQAFDISEDVAVSFQTSAFEVCRGKDVIIDESAYPLMWAFLDEITVVVDELAQAPMQRRKSKQKAPEILPTPIPTPAVPPTGTPDRHRTGYMSVDVNKYEHNVQRDEDNHHKLEEYRTVDEEEDAYDDPPPKSLVQERHDDKGEGGSRLRRKFKPAVTSDDELPPEVKKEKIPVRSITQETSRRDKSPEKPPPMTEDGRFDITIHGPPPENLVAQFKTRGKHPVRKIVAAACKTFDIDYKRANLMLALSIEDEDGDLQTHRFQCPPADTMSQCSIDSTSKLFIEMKDAGDVDVDSG